VGALRIRRIQDAPESGDGFRVLVDRIWPRGVSKEQAALDLWAREAAPSDALRKEYHAGALGADGFRARYLRELERNSAAHAIAETLMDRLAQGDVTLLSAAAANPALHAVVLSEWIVSAAGPAPLL
jgi:uncharacterized protein YeaO (DUF488 family)